jgi:hypothetical protein
MDVASVVAHHLTRLQQPVEIFTDMLLKTIAHNPLVRSSTLRGGTIATILDSLAQALTAYCSVFAAYIACPTHKPSCYEPA